MADLRITGADHTNWRVRDLGASLAFYEDVFGFEPFGIEEYESGERPLVSLRVTDGFILHLVPDAEFDRGSETGGYDHLALVVEGVEIGDVEKHLQSKGVEVEKKFESIVGAKGRGPAIYVRDPDGYRIELKLYPKA